MISLRERNSKVAIPRVKQIKDSKKHKKLTKLLAMSNEKRWNSLKDANAIKNAIDNLSASAFNSIDE